MNTEDKLNEIAKIDIELALYMNINSIPFKLTEENIWIIETTKCSEYQKDKLFEIENKKKQFITN